MCLLYYLLKLMRDFSNMASSVGEIIENLKERIESLSGVIASAITLIEKVRETTNKRSKSKK